MNFLHITIIIRVRVVPCGRRCLLARPLKLLLLPLLFGELTNAFLLTFIITITLLVTVAVIFNVGIHHLLKQCRLIIQLSIIRMDLVLRKCRCIMSCELYTLCVVKANVGIAQNVQVELILTLPWSQELDFVFHNFVGTGDLVNTDDFTLPGSECNPPCLQPGEGESRCMDQASLFTIVKIVTGECDRNGAQISFVYFVILIVINKYFALHINVGKDLAAL
mmetsp:Transcript_17525/g.37880  ORF Transcript_17525/g.37880 Transcript_17525/m.37880 type:complete len:221 (+) Transcript_17525:108-770(+)